RGDGLALEHRVARALRRARAPPRRPARDALRLRRRALSASPRARAAAPHRPPRPSFPLAPEELLMIPNVFDRLESEVRTYCRSFPAVFTRAEGATVHDARGRAYLDFFAGAGALNYGHNPAPLRDALLAYLT